MGVLTGCRPRREVLEGDLEDAIFAADFGDIVAEDPRTPRVYGDPRTFFENTDGRTVLALSPLEFLDALARLIPPHPASTASATTASSPPTPASAPSSPPGPAKRYNWASQGHPRSRPHPPQARAARLPVFPFARPPLRAATHPVRPEPLHPAGTAPRPLAPAPTGLGGLACSPHLQGLPSDLPFLWR